MPPHEANQPNKPNNAATQQTKQRCNTATLQHRGNQQLLSCNCSVKLQGEKKAVGVTIREDCGSNDKRRLWEATTRESYERDDKRRLRKSRQDKGTKVTTREGYESHDKRCARTGRAAGRRSPRAYDIDCATAIDAAAAAEAPISTSNIYRCCSTQFAGLTSRVLPSGSTT
jgi:hypothetical protein